MEKNKLPQGWTQTSLDSLITKISNGTTEKQSREKTKFPVSRIETISNETIDFGRVRYLDNPSPEIIQKYKIKKEDILFSNINSDSHLGKTAIFLDDSMLLHGMNLLLIRPNSGIIHPKFLNFIFNYLRKSGFFYSVAQHAVNQSSINQTKIKSIVVDLPPLNEQKRIVDKIEELFSNIYLNMGNITKIVYQLSIYRLSLLDSAFSVDATKEILLDCGKIGTGGTPSRAKPEYYGNKYPWVKTTEVRNNTIYETGEKITQLGLDNSNAKIYPKNSVILANVWRRNNQRSMFNSRHSCINKSSMCGSSL